MKKLLAAMLLVFGATTGALAEELRVSAENAQAVAVRYTDLDLESPQGAESLFSRIRYASWRVCENRQVERPDVVASREERLCRQLALADAVAELGAPQVSRIYVAHRD